MRALSSLVVLAACGSSAPSPAPVPGATPNDEQLEPTPLEAAPDAGPVDASFAAMLLADEPAEPAPPAEPPIMELEEVILDVAADEVRGGGEQSIRDAIRSRRAAFRACSKQHDVHGTYRATVVVERDGTASDAWGGTDDGARCLLKALKSARYHRSDGGGTAHLYIRLELP